MAIAVYALRRRRGVAMPREIGLLAGRRALVAVFLVSWPLMRAGIALALQLQTSRVFWMLDFLAAMYLAWLFAEAPRSLTMRRAAACDRGRCRRQPRRVRVGRGACRQPDRADRISAG